MRCCIFLADAQHLLQGVQGGGQQEGVIRIAYNSEIAGIHPAPTSISSKNLEKIVHIKAIQDCTEDRALSNSIGEAEHGRESSIPANISKLVYINEDQKWTLCFNFWP